MKFGIQLAGGAPIRTRTRSKGNSGRSRRAGVRFDVDRRSHRHSQKDHRSVAGTMSTSAAKPHTAPIRQWNG